MSILEYIHQYADGLASANVELNPHPVDSKEHFYYNKGVSDAIEGTLSVPTDALNDR